MDIIELFTKNLADFTWLLVFWMAYFAIHSLMASLRMKNYLAKRWPNLFPSYRLFYVVVASILLLPILWWLSQLPNQWVWQWRGIWWWLANGLAVLAILGFFISTRYYDMAEFLGFKQQQQNNRSVNDQQSLVLSPFHRFVRHPWYFFLLVMIWTRDMNLGFLLSAISISIYLWIGSYWEEQKLVIYHGEVYQKYQKAVPALLPLPWKYLTTDSLEHEIL